MKSGVTSCEWVRRDSNRHLVYGSISLLASFILSIVLPPKLNPSPYFVFHYTGLIYLPIDVEETQVIIPSLSAFQLSIASPRQAFDLGHAHYLPGLELTPPPHAVSYLSHNISSQKATAQGSISLAERQDQR